MNGRLLEEAVRLYCGFLLAGLLTMQMASGQATGTVTPFNGSGARGSAQAIQFTASDPGGWQNVAHVDIVINATQSGANGCFFVYFPSSNSIYLFNDSTSGWAPGAAIVGAGGTTSNSQCAINGSGSFATTLPSGTLILTVNVAFSFPIGTLLYYWEQVVENSGASSGWWQIISSNPATFLVTRPGNSPPSIGTLVPLTATSPNVLTFTGSDPDGASDIVEMDVVVNSVPNGGTGCFWVFFPKLNAVYLVQTASPFTWVPIGVSGYQPQVAQSSTACAVSPAGSTEAGSGVTESLNLNLSLSAGLNGTNYVWEQVTDTSRATSGWLQIPGATITTIVPTITLQNMTNPVVAPNFIAGDTYQVSIAAPGYRNAVVSVVSTLNGVSQGTGSVGSTDAYGNFTMTGTQTTVGNWTEQWYVNGFPANPALSFYVATAPDGYSPSSSFPSIPNSFTAPVPPVPCDNISGNWAESDNNGNVVEWELQQPPGGAVSGVLAFSDYYYLDGLLACISNPVVYPATGQYSNGLFTLSASNPSVSIDSCGYPVPASFTEPGITLSPGTTGSCSSGTGSIVPGLPSSPAGRVRPSSTPPAGATPKQIGGQTKVTSLTPRYNVSYAAYIPVDHVSAVSTCQTNVANVPFDIAAKIYLGDANKGTYRATEAVIVSVDGQSHGSLFYAPSETRNYGVGSPANGYSANLSSTVVTPGVYNFSKGYGGTSGTYIGADEDGIPGDCLLWNAYDWADNSDMNGLGVANSLNTQAQVNFYGSGSNPLEPGVAQIRWNMTVTIDDSNPNVPWAAVNYTLSCYPAHIVKVNGVTVYDSQKATPIIPSSNDALHIFNCLTYTAFQVTGSGPKVVIPPN